jgi:hypothetical protein
MAHLITLTNSENDESILLDLDTVVSIEEGHQNTIITTRWGRRYVKDTLSEIIERAYSKTKAVDNAPEMD